MTTEPDHRSDRVAAAVVALFIVAASIGMAVWNARAVPVLAMRPHTVLQAVTQRLNWPTYDSREHVRRDQWTVRLAATTAALGDERYPWIMAGQIALFALAVLLIAAIAGRLAGVRASVVAAGVAVGTPVFWLYALAFDDHLMNAVLLLAALLILVIGVQRGRFALGVAAGAVAGEILNQAFVQSTGILAVAVFFSAALGLALDGARSKTGSPPAPGATGFQTLTVPAGALAGFAVMALFQHSIGLIYWDYLSAEIPNERTVPLGLVEQLRSWLAYAVLIARQDWGPFVTAGVGLATVFALLGRVRGRFFALGWWLPVTATLSVVPKKNPYYVVYAVMAAPVAVALGVEALRREKARWAAGAGFVLVACALNAAAFSGLTPIPPLSSDVAASFQSSPGLSVGPPNDYRFREQDDMRRVAELTAQYRPDSCPRLLIASQTIPSPHLLGFMRYYLSQYDRRIALVSLSNDLRLPFDDPAPFLLTRDEPVDDGGGDRSPWRREIRKTMEMSLPITRSTIGLYDSMLETTGEFVEVEHVGPFTLYRFQRTEPMGACARLVSDREGLAP